MERYKGNKNYQYGIRKLAIGACSVMIGVAFAVGQTALADQVNESEGEPATVDSPSGELASKEESQAPAPVISMGTENKVVEEEKVLSQENPALPASQEQVDKVIEDRKQEFNQNWQFKMDANQKEATGKDTDVADWKKLDLPHDWSIYFDFDHDSPAQNEGGQLNGGDAWYRKTFKLDEENLDKNIRVKFDGVYMDSQVYVNGQLVGRYPSGYNAFSYDITKYLHKDGSENVIAVHAVNKQPSSRWYSGSGIYRDVSLVVTDKVHIEHDGTTILTPKLESQRNGRVDTQVRTKIANTDHQDHEIVAEYQIVKKDGTVVTDLVRTAAQKIFANQTASLHAVLEVERPDLWTVLDEKPALYELVTRIYRDGQLVDAKKDLFGYRYFNWTPNDGFSLNGEKIKFHGVSLHHDHGALGAEENYKAEYRRLKQMKEMGVNAIRTTHNPASEQTLQIAAELGLMVQEEAFDTWYAGKKPFDYGRFFEKEATHPEAKKGESWSDFDLRTMVERGKNNPAIVMWSIGNEIGEANGDAHSLATVKRLVKVVKSVDKTRYVTMGADKFRFGDGSGGHENIAEELDAVGFNYSEDNYQRLREKHPNWLIYGSETSSATRTRGSYFHPEREWVGSNQSWRNYEQSDYGNDRVGWGKTATASWTFDRDHAGYAGQFIWTGTDYIGEPTPWHNQNSTPVKSSYFGIVDTAGIPKNDFYLYQSQWVSADKHPMVHLLPHWNWENPDLADNVADAQNRIPVRAYSNAASVELFLNGQSQGVKQFTKKKTSDGRTYQEGANPDELYLEWKIAYQPGKLEAIARDEAGQEIARDTIVTAGQPAGVRLIKEEQAIAADGKDLTYINYEIVDAAGNVVPTANDLARFHLQGQGEIVGVDNGEQASRERFKAQKDGSWIRKAFNGKGVVIVKSTEQAGSFTLSAHSGYLKSDQVTLFTGKSDKAEKTILGVQNPRIQTILGNAPTLPTEVQVVYSDGSSQNKSVTWSQGDYSQAGLVKVAGLVEGHAVEAEVEVIATASVLPVVKRIQAGTDLANIDKSVVYLLTDGRQVTYDVDQWQIALEDQEKIKVAGSRIAAQGKIAGQVIEASLVVADTHETTPVEPSIELAGKPLALTSPILYQKLAYGEQPGRVEAKAPKAVVTVVQASPANGLRAQVFVQPLDGGARQEYAIQFLQEAAQLDHLSLRLKENQALEEDQKLQFEVVGHYQDGRETILKTDKVQFTSQGTGRVAVRKGLLELHEAGAVQVTANYGSVQGQLDLTIQKNVAPKEVRAIRPVSVVTGLHQQPLLPTSVTIDYDKGFPKVRPVVWEEISEDELGHYHQFVVKGHVEGLETVAEAQVSVEGVIAVEELSVTTPLGQAPHLPESVRTYLSTGKVSSAKVVWNPLEASSYNQVGEFVLAGTIEGSQLPTYLHVRVSDQTENGANISDQWTGSDLPLAFASDSNPSDLVSHVNDKVISFNDQPANRWTNWNRRSQDSVGILFGDSGILTKRSVDNLHVAFHEDSGVGVPKDYTIEYYVGSQVPTLPKNPSFVESEEHVFNDDQNWKPVRHLQAPQKLQAGQMTDFSFDRVETYAIRIRMNKADEKRGVSITEMQIFSKQVAAENSGNVQIKVNGKELPGFNPRLVDYYLEKSQKDNVTAQVSNHGLATVVPSIAENEPVRVIAKAENGDILGEYRLHFTDDATLLARKPVAVANISRLIQRGQKLELPSELPVYFTGEKEYNVKNLAVIWEEVSDQALAKEKIIHVKAKIIGSDLSATARIRIIDESGPSVSDNSIYAEDGNQAFASSTNDTDANSQDRVDYVNDGDNNVNHRWTNWSAQPSANPEVSVGVIFQDKGSIVSRTVNQARVQFYADSGTDVPEKLTLERYVGPEFDIPTYYSNYQAYEGNHPFNNPDNWEAIDYKLDGSLTANQVLQLTFAPASSQALRLRMNRKADKNGIAIVELAFLEPSQVADHQVSGRILVDGKPIENFNVNQLDYHLSYATNRPMVSVTDTRQTASTVVDSQSDQLPVLVRLTSEDGQTVKEYRIFLDKEKHQFETGVAAIADEKPSLLIEDKAIDFETIEEKADDLYLGQVEVVQEGQAGQERFFIEVDSEGHRQVKERQVLVEVKNRIIRVGQKAGTAVPSEGVKELRAERPRLEIVERVLEFQVIERDNPALPSGERRVIQPGRKGIQIVSTEISVTGERKIVDIYEKLSAQDEIVEIGIKESSVAELSLKPEVHPSNSSITRAKSQMETSKKDVVDRTQVLPKTNSRTSLSELLGLSLLTVVGLLLGKHHKRFRK